MALALRMLPLLLLLALGAPLGCLGTFHRLP